MTLVIGPDFSSSITIKIDISGFQCNVSTGWGVIKYTKYIHVSFIVLSLVII